MPKHKSWFWVTAFAAACFFDFLFWQKDLGINFTIWIAILLIAGYLLAWREGKKPAALSLMIAFLALAFAFVPAWRSEPFTRFFGVVLTLAGLLLLAATFLNGNWPFYRMWDYFKGLFGAVGGGLTRAIILTSKPSSTPPPLNDLQQSQKNAKKQGWAILRGLLIALPIVAIFALLLTAADPIFGDWLTKVFNLEKLPQYLFRLIYVIVIGMFLVGIYLHAVLPTTTEQRPDPSEAWVKPFLGWTETSIILGAVDLLFLAFVFIQFRYFFGGATNISETGYTYSEYARRGFGELVATAVISLGLYLLLNTVGKRESKGARIGFSILTVLLMANVMVMLDSSLQRLLLYEDAYGFSQLRTYTHVFIYWLAGLIAVTVILELLRKRGHFALALLVMTLGFDATLAVMDVNGYIATKNIQRAVAGEELDVPYLVSLSSDAVPVLVENFTDPATPAGLKNDLGYALACRKVLMDDPSTQPWQMFNLSTSRAWNLIRENQLALSKFKVSNGDSGWQYVENGETGYCFQGFMD